MKMAFGHFFTIGLLLWVSSHSTNANPNACFEFPVILYSSHSILPTDTADLRRHLQGDLFVLDQANISEAVPKTLNCLTDFTSFLSYRPAYAEFDHIPSAAEYAQAPMPKITYPPVNTSSPLVIYKNVSIFYRGASSIVLPKHQYAVHFNESLPLLQLRPGRDWVLQGPFYDGSMLRNIVGHWLYHQTGRYSAHVRPLVLYVQDLASGIIQYQGIYLCLEHSWVHGNGLDMAKLTRYCDGDELSGGWIWQMNPYKPDNIVPNVVQDLSWIAFGGQSRPVLTYPEEKELTTTMRNYFTDTNTSFLHAYFLYLHNNMTNPDALERHLELGSFVDYILHTELILNQDAYRRSVWYFKDRYQTINAGPAWDLNLAMGIGSASHDTQEWTIAPYIHWKRLLCNYKIAGLLIQRYRELRRQVWSDETIRTYITKKSQPFRQMFARCPNNWWKSNMVFCANVMGGNDTYNATVDHLVDSILKRAKWLDGHITDVYRPLNESVCGPLGELPLYNCGPNITDDGCLREPLKYSEKLTFPPIRKPWTGGECKKTPKTEKEKKEVDGTVEQPTPDPCWKYPFCSNAGSCGYGPHAKCTCDDKYNRNPFDCSPLNLTDGKTGQNAQNNMIATETINDGHAHLAPKTRQPNLSHGVKETIKSEQSRKTLGRRPSSSLVWTAIAWLVFGVVFFVSLGFYSLRYHRRQRELIPKYHTPKVETSLKVSPSMKISSPSYGSIHRVW